MENQTYVPFIDPKYQIENQVAAQKSFFLQLHLQRAAGLKPSFRDCAMRIYSQTDEDGILLWIFSAIGFTNKLCVDMAFASPFGANTTNLICNWGFHGLLVEGQPLEEGHRFFKKSKDTFIVPPKLVQHWITAENINQICEENGFLGDIDFMSLDVDGVDYWLWKKLNVVKPRVIVVESARFLGTDRAITVPYTPDFCRTPENPCYFGASPKAFVQLAHEKGYKLVAVNKFGFNLFFVRNDIAEPFDEIGLEYCHQYKIDPSPQRAREIQFALQHPWVEV